MTYVNVASVAAGYRFFIQDGNDPSALVQVGFRGSFG